LEEEIIEGKILKGIGGFYYVLDSENIIHECKAAGRLRKGKIKPLPGDTVVFAAQDGDLIGFIEKILPRKNQLKRPMVANVDQVVITIAIKSPKPDLILVDKLLIMASIAGIKPIICINKSDLASKEDMQALVSQYSKYFDVYVLCSQNGEGIDRLKATFKDNITCFAGQSAVGKSSILNAIFEHLDLTVGGLSKKTERGKHTTRHAELILIDDPKGIVVDTPGFSMLENMNIERTEIGNHYPEILKYKRGCKFSSCLHINEPECSVIEALKKGLIDKNRYERYLKIIAEMKKEEDRAKW
jgi:ribosome biogenesis GTPase / thiamine phosphate phosphatase